MYLTVGTPIPSATPATITPPPRFEQFPTSVRFYGPQTCGFISSDINSPLACQADQACTSTDNAFFCCGETGCVENYYSCRGPSKTTDRYCGSGFGQFGPCLTCDGSKSYCGEYQLLSSNYTYTSRFCGSIPEQTIYVNATPTNAPKETFLCVPDGYNAPKDTRSGCASPALLVMPLILSNVVVLASGWVLNHNKCQRILRFWNHNIDPRGLWRPWAALSTAALIVVEAVATAALIRAGGYKASWKNLVLLWLTRPRMQWPTLLLYWWFKDKYRRAAFDVFFAGGILNLLALSAALWLLKAGLLRSECPEELYGTPSPFVGSRLDLPKVSPFGKVELVRPLRRSIIGGISVSLFNLLAFIIFTWPGKMKFGRTMAVPAAILLICLFGLAWWFWGVWAKFSEGAFCVKNVKWIAVIHGLTPLLSGLLRAWLA